MRLRRILLGLLLPIVLAGNAPASQDSERLYSRGLVDFHAARYGDALQSFDQAVAADAEDMEALYYRGVTHGHLGNWDSAVADLQVVAERRPELTRAALELGIALLEQGQGRAALPWLEKARGDEQLEAQASLFLGVAYLRLDDNEEALANLRHASAADPALTLAARYYAGLAAYRAGNEEQAAADFEYVVKTSPDSPMGREAAAVLARLAEAPPRKYRLWAEAGFQYDSNVQLAPSDDALKTQAGIGSQEDGRATFNAGGRYTLLLTELTEITAGYNFSQSLHFDLNDYNLQDHRPTIVAIRRVGPVYVGAEGAYDFYLRKDTAFLHEFSGMPWVTLPQEDFGRTDLFYRIRRQAFIEEPFDDLRDALNHSVGLQQAVDLKAVNGLMVLGYRFDTGDPVHTAGDQYGYDGHELSALLQASLPASLSAAVSYAYRHEQYEDASRSANLAGIRRRDDEHELSVSAYREFGKHLSLGLGYFFNRNVSTDEFYEYDRHVVALTLRAVR